MGSEGGCGSAHAWFLAPGDAPWPGDGVGHGEVTLVSPWATCLAVALSEGEAAGG